MNGFITSDNFAKDIKSGLKDEIVFSKIGNFSNEDFLEICKMAARVPIKNLIIDISCTTNEGIVQGIKLYRIQKPTTRIIIFAPGKVPGDLTISDIVNMGVYDIITPELPEESEESIQINYSKDISYQIDHPSTYADGVRWIVSSHPKQQVKKKRIEKNEIEVVLKEKLIGSVLIAVAGVSTRSGCTHASIHISSYLAKQKYKVACVELVDERLNQKTFDIFSTDQVSKRNPQGFHVKKIDFFNSEVQLLDLYNSGYDYIVLDFGCLYNVEGDILNTYLHEFVRADYHIVTSTVALWDFENLLNFIQFFDSEKWSFKKKILLNFSNESVLKNIKETFSKQEIEENNISFTNHVNIADPFSPIEESTKVFEELLQEILPKSTYKKGIFKRFMK